MKKILFIALLMVILPAQANEESIRNAIENQISQRHPSLPAGFWEGLGPEAPAIIKKMYLESTSANEKTFLIDGLSHFNDTATGNFLEKEVANTQNEVLKKKLLSAVVQSEGERAVDFVAPYLKDSDGHVRLAVARALGNLGDEKSKNLLSEYRASEKTPWVLAELKRKPAEDLQRAKKHGEQPAPKVAVVNKNEKVIPPLPEKSWAGLWRGSYITENKVILLEANLLLQDASSTPLKWKVEFKFPKQAKQEWKNGEFTLNYFQTNRAHWMEIRNPKMDIVFLAQRKATP